MSFPEQWQSNESIARLSHQLQHLRPWTSEFFSREQFSWPDNLSDTQKRLVANCHHFSANYLLILLILLTYSLLTNFWMFLVAVASAALFFVIKSLPPDYEASIAGKRLSVGTLQIGWVIGTAFLLWFCSVGSVLVGLVGMATVVIGAHASLHEVPIETDFAASSVV